MPPISARVAVATHVLAYLTWRHDEPVPSSVIAASVNTNPVVVRRLVSRLRRAGLVTVAQGTQGGAALARPAESITLGDVYRAVERDELFTLHQHTCPTCPVGSNIGDVLCDAFAQAEEALERELDRTTVRQVYDRLAKPERPRRTAGTGA